MMYPANQWSLDLETLATDERAVVLSIGLAKFDPESNKIIAIINHVIGSAEQRDEYGRTVDPQTVAWWTNQSEEAREVIKLSEESEDDVHEILHVTKQAMGRDPIVWGNGSDFDNVVLRTLFKDYGIQPPWHFRKSRDMRTLCALEPLILGRLTKSKLMKVDPVVDREGTHHNAGDDAVYQAKVIMRLLRAMQL